MKLIARNHGPIMDGAARSRMRAAEFEESIEEMSSTSGKTARTRDV